MTQDSQEKVDRLSRQYINSIFQEDMLSRESEMVLIKAWTEDEDRRAFDKLVTTHRRLAIKIAREYKAYQVPFEDLVQEGTMGLMEAARRFDPAKEVRFATYAMWWIRAYVQHYVLSNWSMVRFVTTNERKKLFFRLRAIKICMGISPGHLVNSEEAQEIAEEIAVRANDVLSMDERMSARDGSLNDPVGEEGEMEFQDLIVDERETPEDSLETRHDANYYETAVHEAVARLSLREQTILRKRRLREDGGLTLEDLSRELNISRERVRQIEQRAMRRMKVMLSPQLRQGRHPASEFQAPLPGRRSTPAGARLHS